MTRAAGPAARQAVARLAPWAGVLASAVLCGAYARGGAGCLLGFVALVPWLRALDARPTLAATLRSAWAMAVAYTAAVFAWFGSAIGAYTGIGDVAGVALLLLAAPLFQPQFLAFALARRLAARHPGRGLAALAGAAAGAAAWVATEAFMPRLLGDTFGQGLQPARLLRQAADVGGTAGLTVLLLLANEALAAALAARPRGLRALRAPLACAVAVPLLLAGYGLVALQGDAGTPRPAASPSASTSPPPRPLRIGLVQSGIVDYERLRAARGAGAVVREVLDTHFAMSYDAIEHQHADAVLWSETVYPTTFGHPKSDAGAELDREILAVVDAAGVPFVFGTYDRDGAGEYNAAAFVAPHAGLLGLYRKTRLFPLTERVPPWLDGPLLRRWLPWAGTWRPGDGARVFPLRLADGREIPVQPLICRDDVDTGLAIDGARLGAQALLTMSNDAWFSAHPQGARLHLAAAAFRSIETRLPQFRVATDGVSAVIDATGRVTAASRVGERTLVVGDVAVRVPPRTLVVAWGDWVGRAGAGVLAGLLGMAAWRHWGTRAAGTPAAPDAPSWPWRVAVLPPAGRIAAGVLRAVARASLLGMAVAVVAGDGPLHVSTLAQLRAFAGWFLAPEAAAWCVLQAFAARASLDADGRLVLARGAQRLALPLAGIAAVRAWRLPVPSAGVSLWLATGERWRFGLAMRDPGAFARALAAAGGPALAGPAPGAPVPAPAWLPAPLPPLPRGAGPVWKFVALPLALALPAFRLHQLIAYGSAFGELETFGWRAYATTFALWWGAWTVGVVLCAAALRAVVEAGALGVRLWRPARATAARWWLERGALAVLYLGLPGWLVLRLMAM